MNPYLSVVIPAYNESAILPVTLDGLRTFLNEQPFTAEVIIVDDGSRDETPGVIAKWQGSFDSLRLLRNLVNAGKGASIRRGVLASAGQYVFVTDADLPGRPGDILRLLQALREGATIAIASRPPAPMRSAPSSSRFLASVAYRAMVRAILNLPLRDTQCGFKAFVRKPVLPVFEALQLGGFSFDVEFLYTAWKRELAIREIDFEVIERRATRHAILLQSPRMLLDLLRIRLRSGRRSGKAMPESAELKTSPHSSEPRYFAPDYWPRQK